MMQDRIREGLLGRAGLTEQQVADALSSERETGQTLDQVLVNRNLLPEQQCLEFFGEFLGLEVLPSLEGVSVPSAFIQNIPGQPRGWKRCGVRIVRWMPGGNVP